MQHVSQLWLSEINADSTLPSDVQSRAPARVPACVLRMTDGHLNISFFSQVNINIPALIQLLLLGLGLRNSLSALHKHSHRIEYKCAHFPAEALSSLGQGNY